MPELREIDCVHPPRWTVGVSATLVAATLVLAFVHHTALPFNHDVAWFFFVARGTLFHGGVLYRDFIEPNLPLASLSLAPAVWFAEYTHVDAQKVVVAYVLLVILIAFLLTVGATRGIRLTPAQHLGWRLVLVAGFCFIPGYQFGQREHLIAVLLLPYLVVAAKRYCALPLSPVLAGAIGICAGIAFGLKPLAVLILLPVEMILLTRHRRISVLFRPETVAVALVAGAIVADLAILHQRYFAVAHWAVALYGGYDSWAGVGRLMLFLAVAYLVATLFRWRSAGSDPVVMALLSINIAAAIGAATVFVVQGKGWNYQALPLVYSLFVVAGLPMLQPRLGATRLAASLGLLGVIAFGFSQCLARPLVPPYFAALEQRINNSTGAFYILSTNVWPSFPLAVLTGHRWASRFPCLIMLPGLLEAQPEEEIAAWETWFRNAVSEDIERYRPVLVFVPWTQDQAMPANFDVLGWFKRSPNFSREWQSYRRNGTIGRYAVYERASGAETAHAGLNAAEPR